MSECHRDRSRWALAERLAAKPEPIHVPIFLLLFAAHAVVFVPRAAAAGTAAGYYDEVDTSSPISLRQSLHDTIDDHTRVPYSAHDRIDTWDVLERADEDPSDPGAVLDIYRNASIPKAGGGNDLYKGV